MNKPINSQFRYPGGKFYARNLILNHIPSHSYYTEPFAGGGSIFFVKNQVNSNWLNDIDELLINTLLIIRDQPEELINFLEGESATKERHTYYKIDKSDVFLASFNHSYVCPMKFCFFP